MILPVFPQDVVFTRRFKCSKRARLLILELCTYSGSVYSSNRWNAVSRRKKKSKAFWLHCWGAWHADTLTSGVPHLSTALLLSLCISRATFIPPFLWILLPFLTFWQQGATFICVRPSQIIRVHCDKSLTVHFSSLCVGGFSSNVTSVVKPLKEIWISHAAL